MAIYNVVIQVFSTREKEPSAVVRMWQDQNTIPGEVWDIDYQLCRNNPEDAIMFTENVGDVTTINVSGGKLDARNQAHNKAYDQGYDIIVAAGADAKPRSQNTLPALLHPFHSRQNVVAVDSNPVSDGLYGSFLNAVTSLEDSIRPHISRQCSAFTAEAWDHAGPFDAGSVDQRDRAATRIEEERRFYKRLNRYGKVVKAHNAVVENQKRIFDY